jgi:hypothetical protein
MACTAPPSPAVGGVGGGGSGGGGRQRGSEGVSASAVASLLWPVLDEEAAGVSPLPLPLVRVDRLGLPMAKQNKEEEEYDCVWKNEPKLS